MNSHGSPKIEGINITPLTDIFLVLLIIMMVVAPLLEYRGLSASLVSDSASPEDPNDEKKEITMVSIAPDGTFTVEGEAVASTDLPGALGRQATTHPDGVLIEIHPDAALESLTRAMDSAQAAGIANVSLLEKAPPAETPSEKPKK